MAWLNYKGEDIDVQPDDLVFYHYGGVIDFIRQLCDVAETEINDLIKKNDQLVRKIESLEKK